MIRINYINTGIENIKDFFGREKLIEEIKHRLKSFQSLSLYGERKIGKTSLMKYLFQVGIREISLPGAEQVVIVYQTFAGKQNISPDQFLLLLYEELRREVNHAQKPEEMDTFHFERFIRDSFNAGKRFIFFLDELDKAPVNLGFDHNFFSFLRSLSEMYRVQYLIASRRSIKDLIFENNVVSPFNGLFSGSVFKLEVFGKDEAFEFCKKLSREAMAGNSISEDKIISLAGKHPFLIRLAYIHAINTYIESDDGKVDYEKLATVFAKESFHAYFSDVWDHMDKEERLLLRQIAENKIKDNPGLLEKDMIEDFVGRGMITLEESNKYVFLNPYFRTYVKECKPESKTLEVIDEIAGFDKEIFASHLKKVEEHFDLPGATADDKGKTLEDLVDYLFTSHSNYFEVKKQLSTLTASIDFHLWFKPGDDPVLQQLGNEIVVECKNWKGPVGKPEINDIAGDMVSLKCRTGILIARKGITGKEFKDAAGQRRTWFLSENNLVILVVTLDDLKTINEGKGFLHLLKEKYEELIEG